MPGRFCTWLAYCLCIAHAWKKEQGRRPDQDAFWTEDTVAAEDGLVDWPSHTESPETLLWQQELTQSLSQAMAELPQPLSQALSLREQRA